MSKSQKNKKSTKKTKRKRKNRGLHQILHLPTGFIGLPNGHWKALANVFELDKVPMTRYWPGLCTLVSMSCCTYSGVLTEHHNFKTRKQVRFVS